MVFESRDTISNDSAVVVKSNAITTLSLDLSRVVDSSHDSPTLVELDVAVLVGVPL